ncbi:hypothetical protein CAPTEDRAFT_227408 [Capitella teleta]|uniref:MTP large subunit lipid-binding domain-containing protein n=2 Tax=Capitella teleta TaxID=283909 RepID=R7URG2_CAPTE|nr:hypothetical protein CAPTEDRAFT_227408 [Capitella teleta]|eukprot:ELU08723.1 hypothetical protein CAPTEDRAFT_227408 [Capitella teleta]
MGSDNLQTQEVREAMKRIFHQRSQGFDTAVRSKAFSMLVESGLSQDEISEILDESTDPWNTEYDSYIQARLDNLAQRDSDIKRKLKNAMKNVNVSNYDVMSPKGKALAFTSPLANLKDLTAEYYMYVENSKAGILKRSGMDVTATSPTQSMPLYSFGIFAAGLESLLGEEVEAGQEDVEATAGISLDLLGVSLRPISFFTGQSGLMSAVWNAPSEPVSALQTNLLLQDHSKRLHLSNGLIVEHQLMGAISLDLSGSLSVSLWNKNAKCLIKNSAAVVMTGKTNIITSSFRTGIDFDASSLSRIDFQSDVDFYDGIKSCLQMGRPNVTFKHNVSKFESARGFKKSFRANIRRTQSSDAVSYPLPPRNNQECRKLMATNS